MTNTRRSVVPGDIWEFEDPDEGWVEWRVDEVEGNQGTLRKLTGNDVGYPARKYPVDKMAEAANWRWKSGSATEEVLFSCPHCGEDKPIPDGDYVCATCRTKLG